MKQRLYKASELAEILGLNVQTIYRKADRGEIEDFRIGNTRRFLMPGKGQNNDTEGENH